MKSVTSDQAWQKEPQPEDGRGSSQPQGYLRASPDRLPALPSAQAVSPPVDFIRKQLATLRCIEIRCVIESAAEAKRSPSETNMNRKKVKEKGKAEKRKVGEADGIEKMLRVFKSETAVPKLFRISEVTKI